MNFKNQWIRLLLTGSDKKDKKILIKENITAFTNKRILVTHLFLDKDIVVWVEVIPIAKTLFNI